MRKILSYQALVVAAMIGLQVNYQAAQAALNNSACNYKMFPIFAGGVKDEDVRAFEVDSTTNQMFVGGRTESGNFGPADNPHGFIYAVSELGDWIWGQFFYNVSYPITQIDGIVMSQKNNFVTCLGQANNKPIIMTLNKQKGNIQKFYTVDPVDSPSKTSYSTLQAVYHEETPDDNSANQFYYVSFLMSIDLARTTHIMKFRASDLLLIWHKARVGSGSNTVPTAAPIRDEVPRFFAMDSLLAREFYLMGKFTLHGSGAEAPPAQGAMLFRINKNDGKFLYQTKFQGLDDVTAYVQPQGTNFLYGCGQDPSNVNPSLWKMTNNGDKVFFYSLTMALDSTCQGLTYDASKFESTLLIRSNLETYKRVNTGFATKPNDAFLYIINDQGVIIRAQQISFSSALSLNKDANIKMAANSLRRLGLAYAFPGFTTGFSTQMQSETFNNKDNTFLMKYLFDKDNSFTCIYEAQLQSLPAITTSRTITKQGVLDSTGLVKDSTNTIIEYQKYFQILSSPYSGAFDLTDTQYIPRPCASAFANLTQMDYFYGQRKKSYNMRDEPSFKQRATQVFAQMDKEREFVFQNGSKCDRFAWLDSGSLDKNTTIWVQTDEENLVGTQRTVIRGCDSMNKLLEINFYVNVTSNSAPEFTEDIQTQWNLNVGDKINYVLPPFKDPEGNDVGEVYINSMENQDFPQFIKYSNDTQTINMNPNNLLYQGRTYYFSVVLKEKNSDFMMNIYYMTIKINGDPIDPDDLKPPNKTEVAMTISYLNYHSEGNIRFSMEVLPFIFKEENKMKFWDLFDVYVINTVKDREEILDIVFTDYNQTNVNFTVQFQKPYMYGLLNKKSDNLVFRCKNVSDEELVGMLVLNATNQTLKVLNDQNVTVQQKIGMQFDFRDDTMMFYRNLAVALYYVMIAIIIIQFFILLARKVSFLPLWTLIEYMQLIAFMPLYNFKLIPYLYDAFKPMLVGHIILFNDSMLYKEMSDDYFNINYEYYWLPVSKLIQSLMNILILLGVLIFVNITLFLMTYCCKGGRFENFINTTLSQFKFNAYIRFYMLIYFDFTFFAIMKIMDGNNSTLMRKVATFISYFFFVASIIMPIFFLAVILRKHPVLKEKEGKSRFNTLLLKIDKASKWRNIQPILFFGRRIVTVYLHFGNFPHLHFVSCCYQTLPNAHFQCLYASK